MFLGIVHIFIQGHITLALLISELFPFFGQTSVGTHSAVLLFSLELEMFLKRFMNMAPEEHSALLVLHEAVDSLNQALVPRLFVVAVKRCTYFESLRQCVFSFLHQN